MNGVPALGLTELLRPRTLREFLASNWPHRWWVHHGDVARIRPLLDLPELADVDALLSAWPGAVSAFRARSGDESDAVAVNTETARRLWRDGYSLTFLSASQAFPYLDACLQIMAEELRLPPATGSRCILYATPGGAGAAAHFDQNANFVVHLRGRKSWVLATNENVRDPTTRHVIGRVPDPELASQLESELPRQLPESAEEVELRPGTLLFVPRGTWHQTHADTNSLSLNFTFSQRTWADVVADAVRQRLVCLPQWRELAHGLGSSDPAAAAAAEARAAALLERWVSDIGDLGSLAESRPGSGRPVGIAHMRRGWVAIDDPED